MVDARVADVLRVKTYLGLFEDPYTDETLLATAVNSLAHQELALQAARESIVLLKNDNGALPLDAQKKQIIALIGPHADSTWTGDYSVSIL